MTPTISATGTNPEALCNNYREAGDSIRSSIQLVFKIAPRPSDYATQEDWSKANLIHSRWLAALGKIRRELEEAEVEIHDQMLGQK